jgi:hypothetical protein
MTDDTSEVAWEKDQMGRAGVAKFLTSYLDGNAKIKVLNINASWGAGKSFFLHNWLLEQQDGRACVYFNAWENDYTGDAFVSLVSVIRDQLNNVIGVPVKAEGLIKDFTSKAAKAVVAATPALAKGVVKKFTGVDFDIVGGMLDEDVLGEAAEKAVEKLISSNKESLNIVKEFKAVFHELLLLAAGTVAAGSEKKPVYIFIDELDRCRPTFSIELLERLKHLFDAEDCKFIIATDTPQLIEAIRAVYGAGFDSGKYLKRFFDVEFSLDSSNKESWVKVNFSLLPKPQPAVLGHVLDDPRAPGNAYFPDSREPVAADPATILSGSQKLNADQIIFLALAKTFGCQLRELERIVMKIQALQTNIPTREFHLIWGGYLVFLKEEAPDLYRMAIQGDSKKAMREIQEKFSASKLSFVSENISVHQIFDYYLDLYRAGREGARNMTRLNSEPSYHYQSVANMGFFSDYDYLALYPKIVDLSHSLK